MGHYTLGHNLLVVGTNEHHERPANIKAVEVLERVGGRSREEALRTMCDYLFTNEVAMREHPNFVLPPGHIRPSREIKDLVAAFPDQREIARTWSSVAGCADA